MTVNDRIAARLTEGLGSVWAFYVAAGTQVLWIVLAETGVQRFDPYPFAFMSFLSTLAQLVFMIVIMVGREVVGRAGDRRSEQTFLDAQAVLHECRRMKARLNAQDRVIDSLTGYLTTQVTEQLARAVRDTTERLDHQARAHTALTTGQAPADAAVLRRWDELSGATRACYRARARRIGENLAAVGCFMVPEFDPDLNEVLEDQVRALASLEYTRLMAERVSARSADAPEHPHDDAEPLPWDELPPAGRIRYLQAARQIPDMVAHAGFQVLRATPDNSALVTA